MRRRHFILGTSSLLLAHSTSRAQNPFRPADARHFKVYYEKGRFGGWPANYGMWNWGNEIVTGFSRGWYKDLGPDRHHIDRERPEEHCLARSLDGGETWTIEYPAERGDLVARGPALHGTETPDLKLPEPLDCPGGIDFTHPDFAMTIRMTNIDGGISLFSCTYDRGRDWEGPFKLPLFDTPGVAARTDYIVEGKHAALIFLTAAKANKREGRPFCARTTDGGATWKFVAFIGPEPEGYSIMPSTARLASGELITTVRCRLRNHSWIETWRSSDDGATWAQLKNAVEDTGEGNPPAMILLKDGRLCLTYGVRANPFRICAKLSEDGARTWTPELTLRDDGTDRDVGYPRTLQRPDGKVVTTYYFNDLKTGPERYIGATIWSPPA
jgi:hypothetical protein